MPFVAANLAALPVAGVSVSNTYTADEVLLHSKHFEDFFERDRVRLTELQQRPVMQTRQVIGKLSDWVTADPSVLWLEGSPEPSHNPNNSVSVLAAKVIDLADRSNVPILS